MGIVCSTFLYGALDVFFGGVLILVYIIVWKRKEQFAVRTYKKGSVMRIYTREMETYRTWTWYGGFESWKTEVAPRAQYLRARFTISGCHTLPASMR